MYDRDTGDYFGQVHRRLNNGMCYKRFENIDVSDPELGENSFIPFTGKRCERKPKPVDAPQEEELCLKCDQSLRVPFFKDAVRDHCYITGAFRETAHGYCNMRHFKIDPKKVAIPVVFHNLKGYDAHLQMNEIALIQSVDKLNCIPCTMEKCIHFLLPRPVKVHRQLPVHASQS